MSAKEKKRLIDSLTEAHLAVRATLDKVNLEIPVYKDSGWRVRDIVGHIATWDQEIANSLRAYQAGLEYLTPDLDEEEFDFNERAVLEQQKLSTQEVLKEFELAYDEFKKAIQEIPDDRFPGELLYPWGDERGDIATMVDYMAENIRELGKVKLVQVQPSGLIIEAPSGYFYDVSRRVEVEKLIITSLGIEATTVDGEHVLDIHHINHPGKEYDDDDLVCIGFTSHYAAMSERFGEHLEDGTAGENIIIEYDQEIWMDDLGKQIAIESTETGEKTFLDVLSFAAPCEEFSHFVANSQHEKLPAAELKSTLQFLNNGRRGFLLILSNDQETATVQAGDRVFAIHERE